MAEFAPMTHFYRQTGGQRLVNIVVAGPDLRGALAVRNQALGELGVVTLLDNYRLTGTDHGGQWVTVPLTEPRPPRCRPRSAGGPRSSAPSCTSWTARPATARSTPSQSASPGLSVD
jgi:hypothetical protein